MALFLLQAVYMKASWAFILMILCPAATAVASTPVPPRIEISYQGSQQPVGKLDSYIRKVLIPSLPGDVADAIATQKVKIVFSEAGASDGLFEAYPEEMLITLKSSLLTSEQLLQIVTHEFFHAVHHVLHPGEERWIREGLAQLFEFRILGYSNGLNIAAAFAQPSTPLLAEYDEHQTLRAQYGHDYLYFYYLWSHCGGDALIWDIARGTPGVFGANGLDLVLRGPDECRSFDASATAFEIARIHNHVIIGPVLSNTFFLTSTVFAAPEALTSFSTSQTIALKPYTPVVLAPEVRLNPRQKQLLRIFWLHKSFPYQILDQEPEHSDANWRQLVLRRN